MLATPFVKRELKKAGLASIRMYGATVLETAAALQARITVCVLIYIAVLTL